MPIGKIPSIDLMDEVNVTVPQELVDQAQDLTNRMRDYLDTGVPTRDDRMALASDESVIDLRTMNAPGNPYLAPVDIKPLAGNAPKALTPQYHFRGDVNNINPVEGQDEYDPQSILAYTDIRYNDPNDKYTLYTSAHFLYGDDSGSPYYSIPKIRVAKNNSTYVDFSASSTLINPTDDPIKKAISVEDNTDPGLASVDADITQRISGGDLKVPPISPLYPFTNMVDPLQAKRLNLLAYNRFHIPVADIEHRKAFRHIFITRPECYIMANGPTLSEQCEYDEDFASAYSRVPHILKLLSPRYVCSVGVADGVNSNWNMLLSNRVIEMGNNTNELSIIEGAKGITGYNISLPHIMTGTQGKNIELTFRDTKEFDVYNCIRLWMLYMEKRHRGVFSPSYNGYQKTNGFINTGASGVSYNNNPKAYTTLHPYDRAIEFPCNIFDVITDETDNRILHMTEYVGCFPVSLTNPFSNSANQALTETKVTASFKYQYMIEDRNTSFVHFNYNAGIVDGVGGLNTGVALKNALSFLFKDETQNMIPSNNPTKTIMPQYVGAASMWVGTPYVLIEDYSSDPTQSSVMRTSPYLHFMPLIDKNMIAYGNLGIVNEDSNVSSGSVVQMQPYSSAEANEVSNPFAFDEQAYQARVSEILSRDTGTDDGEKSFWEKMDDSVFGGGFGQIFDGLKEGLDIGKSFVADSVDMSATMASGVSEGIGSALSIATTAADTANSIIGSNGSASVDAVVNTIANGINSATQTGANALGNASNTLNGTEPAVDVSGVTETDANKQIII